MKINFKKIKFLLLVFSIIILLLILVNYKLQTIEKYSLSPYPYGKRFAFTITDDPDANSLEKIKPVYDHLYESGLKTTAAVFTFKATRTNGEPDRPSNYSPGDSCERGEYLEYMKELQNKGFEIAFHGPSWGNDFRETSIKGYEFFKDNFGNYPKMYINHKENLENVYWGKKVAPDKIIENFLKIFIKKSNYNYAGEIQSNKYFWGDILKKNTKYVRMFGTQNINTLKFNPSMPYHDNNKYFVNYWFSYSNGNGVDTFSSIISNENIERLEKERGTCIIYTHFGQGFYKNGLLNKKFIKSVEIVSSNKNGWYVPASTILDRLLLFKKIKVFYDNDKVIIINFNREKVKQITLIGSPSEILYDDNGKQYVFNDEGETLINELDKYGFIVLYKNSKLANEFNKAKLIQFKNLFSITSSQEINEDFISDNLRNEKYYFINGITIEEFSQNIDQYLSMFNNNKIILIKDKRLFIPNNNELSLFEKYNLFIHRAISFWHDNYGK